MARPVSRFRRGAWPSAICQAPEVFQRLKKEASLCEALGFLDQLDDQPLNDFGDLFIGQMIAFVGQIQRLVDPFCLRVNDRLLVVAFSPTRVRRLPRCLVHGRYLVKQEQGNEHLQHYI